MPTQMRSEFGVQETHGILWRSENRVHVNSRGLGWASMYASMQTEAPYADRYSAVDDHLIIVHRDGPVAVTRRLGKNQTRRVIAPGGLFILPGGMDFGVELEGELNTLHIYLRKYIVEEVAREFGSGPPAEIVPGLGSQDLFVEQLAMGVQEALSDEDAASSIYIDHLAYALAARLLRKHSSVAHSVSLPQGGFTQRQLQRATDYMAANLGQSLTLADLARISGLSPSHFARRFKLTTGVAPHQYLMQMRVDCAKRLLRERMPISEIALECGFSHQEHMTRIFRRFVGMTPAIYRRSVRG